MNNEWRSGTDLPEKYLNKLKQIYLSRIRNGYIAIAFVCLFAFLLILASSDNILLSLFCSLCIASLPLVIALVTQNDIKKCLDNRSFDWHYSKVEWFHERIGRYDHSYVVADKNEIEPIDMKYGNYELAEKIIVFRLRKGGDIYCMKAD